LARYETVKRFEVVDREFTEERGEITPTLKLKRRVVAQSFAESIERMYAE
jgi:long-chain acyl-CoA synthetase